MSSAAKKRERSKGRQTRGSYFSIPRDVANSPRYLGLSGNAVKLLVEFACQYNGYNNGSQAAPWSRMRKRGWKSEGTLWRALNDLLAARLIVQTRQGGLHACSLYALTWHAIDDNARNGVEGTNVAPGGWNDPVTNDVSERPRQPSSGGTATAKTAVGGTPKTAVIENASPTAETAVHHCQNSSANNEWGFD